VLSRSFRRIGAGKATKEQGFSTLPISSLYIGLAVRLLFGGVSPATATINATHNINIEEIQNLPDQYFQQDMKQERIMLSLTLVDSLL